MNTLFIQKNTFLTEFHAPVNQYSEELQGWGISLQETSHPGRALNSQSPFDPAQMISGQGAVDGVDSQYNQSDSQVSEDKREERKALVKEKTIILGLAVPLRFPERLIRESWCWRLVLLLDYTLQGLWSGLFHLSLSPCVEKRT